MPTETTYALRRKDGLYYNGFKSFSKRPTRWTMVTARKKYVQYMVVHEKDGELFEPLTIEKYEAAITVTDTSPEPDLIVLSKTMIDFHKAEAAKYSGKCGSQWEAEEFEKFFFHCQLKPKGRSMTYFVETFIGEQYSKNGIALSTANAKTLRAFFEQVGKVNMMIDGTKAAFLNEDIMVMAKLAGVTPFKIYCTKDCTYTETNGT